MPYIGNPPANRFVTPPEVQRFNGDNSTTEFTLANTIGADQDILVSVDGVIQDTTSYSVNDKTLTFTTAPSSGTNNIFVFTISPLVASINHPATSPLNATSGTFTGTVAAGVVTVDNITIDATEIDSTSALTLDSAGTISLDADSGSINLLDGGVTHAELINSSNDFIIKSSQSDKDIIFKGVDGISLIEAMRIDMSAGGKVGIGQTNPDSESLVDLGSGENSGYTRKLLVTNTGNSRAGLGALSNILRVFYADDQILQFGTVSRDGAFTFVEKMRIDTGARLAFGNTDTNAKITVSQNGNALNLMRLQNTDGTNNARFIQFANSSNTDCGHIDQVNATTIAYNTTSDYRLKQNINYTFDATTEVKKLKPCTFSWKHDDTDKSVYGFLAHEVSEIVSEAVSGTKDATRDIGTIRNENGDITAKNAPQAQVNTDKNETWEKTGTENVYQGYDAGKLVPLLVKTIQELEARITALENA